MGEAGGLSICFSSPSCVHIGKGFCLLFAARPLACEALRGLPRHLLSCTCMSATFRASHCLFVCGDLQGAFAQDGRKVWPQSFLLTFWMLCEHWSSLGFPRLASFQRRVAASYRRTRSLERAFGCHALSGAAVLRAALICWVLGGVKRLQSHIRLLHNPLKSQTHRR